MKARVLFAVPLLAAGALATGTTHQYDVTIRGNAMAVVARQGPEGVDAETEIRSRSTSARISVTTADTAGGRVLAVTVDTMVLPPPPPSEPNVQIRGGENGTGATWRGLIGGRATRHLAATGPMSARQLDDAVLFLVPELPDEIAAGAAWSDTSTFEITAGQSRASLRIVSDYRVTGGDEQEGFQLSRDFRAERTSRSRMEQGEVLIESRTTGRADYALDADRTVGSLKVVRNIDTDMHLPQVDRALSAATTDTIEVSRR